LERIVGSDLRMWDFLVKIYGLGAKNGKVDDEDEFEADGDEVDTG